MDMNKSLRAMAFAMAFLFAVLMVCVVYAGSSEPAELVNITYTVKEGECLWTIARRYCPDSMDIRDYIHKVKLANHMESESIRAGQTITVFDVR